LKEIVVLCCHFINLNSPSAEAAESDVTDTSLLLFTLGEIGSCGDCLDSSGDLHSGSHQI